MEKKYTVGVILGTLGLVLMIVLAAWSVNSFSNKVGGIAKKRKAEEAELKRGDSALAPLPVTDGIEMVMVEGGKFDMGGWDGGKDEEPRHKVVVRNFYIGKYEVTQEQWKELMGDNPSDTQCSSCPVESVSWDDAQRFINKLNEKVGSKRYSLPTEAEWEYASLGGKQTLGYEYSGSDEADSVAWYAENSNEKTQKVGSKKPNELGIYDMSGNVQEWCNDWYEDYASSLQRDPKGPEKGDFRVLRGGSMTDTVTNCRSRHRSCGYPQYGFRHVGFRVVAH